MLHRALERIYLFGGDSVVHLPAPETMAKRVDMRLSDSMEHHAEIFLGALTKRFCGIGRIRIVVPLAAQDHEALRRAERLIGMARSIDFPRARHAQTFPDKPCCFNHAFRADEIQRPQLVVLAPPAPVRE